MKQVPYLFVAFMLVLITATAMTSKPTSNEAKKMPNIIKRAAPLERPVPMQRPKPSIKVTRPAPKRTAKTAHKHTKLNTDSLVNVAYNAAVRVRKEDMARGLKCVPAYLVTAITISESSYLRKPVTNSKREISNNYNGIKCYDCKDYVLAKDDGKICKFAKYKNIDGSIRACYAILRNERYSELYKPINNNVNTMTKILTDSYYASNRSYHKGLRNIIYGNDLHKRGS